MLPAHAQALRGAGVLQARRPVLYPARPGVLRLPRRRLDLRLHGDGAVHVPRRDRLQPDGGGGGVRHALAVQLRDARRRRPAAGYGVAALCPFSSSAQALTACSACDSRVVAGTVPSTAQLRHLLHAALATCDLRVWLALSEFISCECLLE